MKKAILFLGGSGFVGKHLVPTLLKRIPDDTEFHAVVRSDTAEKDIAENLKWISPDRLSFIRGDVTQRGFLGSLPKRDWEVINLSGSTSFDDSKKEEIERTNIGGTINLLETLTLLDKVKLYHMSTAYVCGIKQNGEIIPAGPIIQAGKTRNYYEETKRIAEGLVRDSEVPSTIIRPSIITGDSKKGDAKGERRMVYGFFLGEYRAILKELGGEESFWRYWATAEDQKKRKELKFRIPGDANNTKNLVTIDDVVNVVLAIRDYTDSTGQTYNLVNQKNLTAGFMLDTMNDALRIKGPHYQSGLTEKDIDPNNKKERLAFKYLSAFHPYTCSSEPKWDTTNLDSLGVKRIEMTERLFKDLIRAYISNNWGQNGNWCN